jgi:hypothetical protein
MAVPSSGTHHICESRPQQAQCTAILHRMLVHPYALLIAQVSLTGRLCQETELYQVLAIAAHSTNVVIVSPRLEW